MKHLKPEFKLQTESWGGEGYGRGDGRCSSGTMCVVPGCISMGREKERERERERENGRAG